MKFIKTLITSLIIMALITTQSNAFVFLYPVGATIFEGLLAESTGIAVIENIGLGIAREGIKQGVRQGIKYKIKSGIKKSIKKRHSKKDKRKSKNESLSIRVISWNLKNLSANSIHRDWSTIRQFISEHSSANVIMLQEIMNKEALRKISNSNFKIVLSKPKGRQGKKEYYGFLVNRKFKNVRLKNFSQYRNFRVPPSVLILDNKTALVNVHIMYGDNTKLSILKRKQEIVALAQIVKKLKKQYKNIIVGGDFNLDIKSDLSIVGLFGAMKMNVSISDATSIGKTYKNRFNQSYDHFISNGISINARVEKEIIKYKSTDRFHKQISDHLPISAIFVFRHKK